MWYLGIIAMVLNLFAVAVNLGLMIVRDEDWSERIPRLFVIAGCLTCAICVYGLWSK